MLGAEADKLYGTLELVTAPVSAVMVLAVDVVSNVTDLLLATGLTIVETARVAPLALFSDAFRRSAKEVMVWAKKPVSGDRVRVPRFRDAPVMSVLAVENGVAESRLPTVQTDELGPWVQV